MSAKLSKRGSRFIDLSNQQFDRWRIPQPVELAGSAASLVARKLGSSKWYS